MQRERQTRLRWTAVLHTGLRLHLKRTHVAHRYLGRFSEVPLRNWRPYFATDDGADGEHRNDIPGNEVGQSKAAFGVFQDLVPKRPAHEEAIDVKVDVEPEPRSDDG